MRTIQPHISMAHYILVETLVVYRLLNKNGFFSLRHSLTQNAPSLILESCMESGPEDQQWKFMKLHGNFRWIFFRPAKRKICFNSPHQLASSSHWIHQREHHPKQKVRHLDLYTTRCNPGRKPQPANASESWSYCKVWWWGGGGKYQQKKDVEIIYNRSNSHWFHVSVFFSFQGCVFGRTSNISSLLL